MLPDDYFLDFNKIIRFAVNITILNIIIFGYFLWHYVKLFQEIDKKPYLNK